MAWPQQDQPVGVMGTNVRHTRRDDVIRKMRQGNQGPKKGERGTIARIVPSIQYGGCDGCLGENQM